MKNNKPVTSKSKIEPIPPDKIPNSNRESEVDRPKPKRGPQDVPVELQHFDNSGLK